MLDNIDKGISPEVFGDGSQSYDFIYVGDCAKANICAMKANVNDRFYNVGSGIKTSIKELALKVLELKKSKLEIKYKLEGTTFVKNRIGCPKSAKNDLNFSYSVSLEDGLKKLIEWRDLERK